MNEIKFRGKGLDASDWVYGFYGYKDLTDEHFIMITNFDKQSDYRPQYFVDHLVKGDSVGQFTGLYDKDSKEIYVGDIITGRRPSHWHGGYDKVKGIVLYRKELASLEVDSSKHTDLMGGGYLYNVEELEVIGNKYDNPELLKGDFTK